MILPFQIGTHFKWKVLPYNGLCYFLVVKSYISFQIITKILLLHSSSSMAHTCSKATIGTPQKRMKYEIR